MNSLTSSLVFKKGNDNAPAALYLLGLTTSFFISSIKVFLSLAICFFVLTFLILGFIKSL